MNTSNNKARSLLMAAALIAVVILVAAWFLLISPTLGAAASANSDAAQQEQTNEQTQTEVNKLRAQFANMDDYQAQLASLQEQIPTDPAYADLQRMFAAVAAEHGVVIMSLQFGNAKELNTAAGAKEEPAEDPGETTAPSPEPTTGDGSAAPTTPETPKGVPGFYGIPVTLSVTGRYDDVMSTLKELQTRDGRLVLVTTVGLAAADARGEEASADSGIDTVGVFGGLTFVLTSSAPPEAPAGGDTTSPSPSPSPTP